MKAVQSLTKKKTTTKSAEKSVSQTSHESDSQLVGDLSAIRNAKKGTIRIEVDSRRR